MDLDNKFCKGRISWGKRTSRVSYFDELKFNDLSCYSKRAVNERGDTLYGVKLYFKKKNKNKTEQAVMRWEMLLKEYILSWGQYLYSYSSTKKIRPKNLQTAHWKAKSIVDC